MKAVRIHEHGGPEVLTFGEIPSPEPGPGEVRVRVRACALNHLDIWVRQGGMPVPGGLPRIPGSDVAGVVDALGEGVDHLTTGDEVVVDPGLSCGRCESCLRGWHSMCREYRLLGWGTDGGCAEFLCVPSANVLAKPSGLDFAQAASLPLVLTTAWHMVVTRARVRPGETVLVHGGGSGVGSMAIQVASLRGARVFTTVGTEWKADKARGLGAGRAIVHTSEDFVKVLQEATSKRGVDAVIDHVGAAVFEPSLKALAHGGRLVTCGATTGPRASFDIPELFAKQLTIMGSMMGGRGELLEGLELVEQGRLRPVVHATYPLAEAAEAHRVMEGRDFFGKLVLEV